MRTSPMQKLYDGILVSTSAISRRYYKTVAAAFHSARAGGGSNTLVKGPHPPDYAAITNVASVPCEALLRRR